MTTDAATEGWLLFDAIEIDLGGRRLFVDAAPVALEPKAFAVLVLLAARPGHAFTRDEILDAVWGHRHVTPGVLNRIVTLLRHALGDSPDAPRYLHTLHGVGYRFDAIMQRQAQRSSGAAGTTAQSIAGARPADRESTEAAAAQDIAPASTFDTQARAAARLTETSNPPAASAAGTARRNLIAFGTLLACLLAAVWYVLGGRAVAPLSAVAPTLVVLPLRPVEASAEENVFADGLSEELITRLARIDGLRLISRTSALLAQSEKLDLPQLADRLHVTHALEGSLRQSGQQLRIDLRLVEIPQGRTLWAQDYDRNLADVFAIQSEIAKAVAAALTLKLGLVAATVEPDPQQFRAYLQFRHRLLTTPDPGAYQQLIAELRAQAARAPDDADVHGLLARALVRELRAGVMSSEAERAEATRAAGRALELDPAQLDARSAAASLACRAAQWLRCLSGYEQALQLAPADSALRTTYGIWLADLGYLDKALAQLDIGVASDPLKYEASLLRGRVLDTLGRHADAQAAFEVTLKLPGGSPERLAYARWFNAVWRRDFAAARAFASDMSPAEHFRDSYIAVTEALVDPARWPQAEPLIEASERTSGHYNFLRPFQPGADRPKVIAALDQALTNRVSSYHLLLWTPENAALRRDPAFQESLRRTGIIDYWRGNGWPAQCRPDGDGARCD